MKKIISLIIFTTFVFTNSAYPLNLRTKLMTNNEEEAGRFQAATVRTLIVKKLREKGITSKKGITEGLIENATEVLEKWGDFDVEHEFYQGEDPEGDQSYNIKMGLDWGDPGYDYNIIQKERVTIKLPSALFNNPIKLASVINEGTADIYDAIAESWDRKMESGNVFKYNLSELKRKKVGTLAAMFNPGRAGKREVQMDTKSLNKLFDPAKFNFNKVADDEVIAEGLDLGGVDTDIIANVSPFLKGHVLIVPERKKNHNQYFIPEAATAALEILRKINRKSYKVTYNSVGAFASINHLHLQALDYQIDKMPVEDTKKELLFEENGVSVSTLPDWFLNGFALTSDNAEALQAQLLILASMFQEANQPFNIIFSYNEPVYSVYIFPRKFQGPSKFGTGVAYLEIGGEVLFVKQEDKTMEESLQVYETVTEEAMADELYSVGVDLDKFIDFKRNLKDLNKVRSQV